MDVPFQKGEKKINLLGAKLLTLPRTLKVPEHLVIRLALWVYMGGLPSLRKEQKLLGMAVQKTSTFPKYDMRDFETERYQKSSSLSITIQSYNYQLKLTWRCKLFMCAGAPRQQASNINPNRTETSGFSISALKNDDKY